MNDLTRDPETGRRRAAVETLLALGYKWEGGALWKPPIKTPSTRYSVIEGSDSGHCCFEASVIEGDKKDIFTDAICECMNTDVAYRIARLLNASEAT
jgi:hypothetical protein